MNKQRRPLALSELQSSDPLPALKAESFQLGSTSRFAEVATLTLAFAIRLMRQDEAGSAETEASERRGAWEFLPCAEAVSRISLCLQRYGRKTSGDPTRIKQTSISWCGVHGVVLSRGKLIPRMTSSAVTQNQSSDFCWKSYACECSDWDCVRASLMTAPCHPLMESFGQRVSSWVDAYPRRSAAEL